MDWLLANKDEEEENDVEMNDAAQTAAAAEFHASKTGHENFSESTEALKPLTAEEKAAKVKELQERLAQKREERKQREIEEEKAREKVRRVSAREIQESREKMQELEMKKLVEQRRKEKEADRLAKERIKAQIEADKRERQRQVLLMINRKREEAKNNASGIVAPVAQPVAPRPASSEKKDYAEARIQIRMPSGPPVTQTFPATAPLQIVYDHVAQQHPGPFKLATTFPRKVLEEKTKTLQELGLAPSAALALV